jgi:hypothetical protein
MSSILIVWLLIALVLVIEGLCFTVCAACTAAIMMLARLRTWFNYLWLSLGTRSPADTG